MFWSLHVQKPFYCHFLQLSSQVVSYVTVYEILACNLSSRSPSLSSDIVLSVCMQLFNAEVALWYKYILVCLWAHCPLWTSPPSWRSVSSAGSVHSSPHVCGIVQHLPFVSDSVSELSPFEGSVRWLHFISPFNTVRSWLASPQPYMRILSVGHRHLCTETHFTEVESYYWSSQASIIF